MATKTPTRRGQNGRKRVSNGRTSKKRPTRRSAGSRLAGGSSRSKAPARGKAAARRPAKKQPAKKSGKSSPRKSGGSTFALPRLYLRDRLRDRLGRQADDVWGVVLLVVAVLLSLAFLGLAGPVGRFTNSGLTLLFGLWAYGLPPILAVVGLVLALGRRTDTPSRIVMGSAAVFIGSLALFHLLSGAEQLFDNVEVVRRRGGAVGSLIAFPLRRLLGTWGAFVILMALISMGVLIVTRTSVRELFHAIGELLRFVRELARTATIATRQTAPVRTRGRHIAPSPPKPPRARAATKAKASRPKASKPAGKPAAKRPDPPRPARTGDYQLPPLELLEYGGAEDHDRRALEDMAGELEDTLRQHGVDATLTKIVPGPTVTRYEIELAPGVKVNRVSNLSHDIAYALATPDVRLLVPIPGKSAIGVEVPNRRRRMVTLGDILRSPEAEVETHPLTVGLGMDIHGRPKLLNLAELPHVLIAGATGAGKSSCINSVVTSLLARATPDDVRLIMVDPKRVELGQYNGVPHLLTRVITNPKKANDALKWAVAEMDRRYDLLADAKVRDIGGYREKLEAGELDEEQFDRFPYIVVIVDELNDLMMVAGREVEESIVRIAQMARAVGIHLVLATQRPSVNVITGVIKANVPSRLAFSVASQTDSRVIIDSAGAEKLVGLGDMLVITAKEPRPQRIQGSFVRENEIHDVVSWVTAQREAQYRDKEVLEVAAAVTAAAAAADVDDEEERLIQQAMIEIVRSQLGSTSMLQRKLRVGFARAGRIMDVLESRGVVGPSLGSKARDVLMTEDELDELLAGTATTGE